MGFTHAALVRFVSHAALRRPHGRLRKADIVSCILKRCGAFKAGPHRSVIVRGVIVGWLVSIWSIAAAGCVTTTYSGTTSAPTTRVDVYTSESEIKVPYSVIGVSRAVAGPSLPEHAIRAQLVEDAKVRGADGIIIHGARMETIGTIDTADGAAGRTSSREVRDQVVEAQLIRYKRR